MKSKRKQRSDDMAQLVCRELRYMLADNRNWDSHRLIDRVLKWMRTTGKIKMVRP